jgi:hypothetical protein
MAKVKGKERVAAAAATAAAVVAAAAFLRISVG